MSYLLGFLIWTTLALRSVGTAAVVGLDCGMGGGLSQAAAQAGAIVVLTGTANLVAGAEAQHVEIE